MKKSGRCPEPMKRSLRMMASPGSMDAAGYSRITWRTMEGMAPRWPGLKSPWAIISPRALKSAAEKSRPSRTACEYAVWRSAVPASSAIDCSAAHTTARVIGSTREPAMAMALRLPSDIDHEVAVSVDGCTVPRQQDDGRLALLDHGRARHDGAGAQPVAIVNRAIDEPALLGEVDGPRSLAGIAIHGKRCRSQVHRGGSAADLDLPVRRLERRSRSFGIAVPVGIDLAVSALDGRKRLRSEPARWDLDAQLVPLSRIAHLGQPSHATRAAETGGLDLRRALG